MMGALGYKFLPGETVMVKHGALSKSHVQQLLRSKDARVRRAAFTLLEMSNPRLRRNSELFIEITRFIWDANPSYEVYQEFTKRHFQVRHKVHELMAPEATKRVKVCVCSPSMPKIWERSSRSCSGDFSSANADDKSSPNAHSVSKNLLMD
jgi:hypothetical protein